MYPIPALQDLKYLTQTIGSGSRPPIFSSPPVISPRTSAARAGRRDTTARPRYRCLGTDEAKVSRYGARLAPSYHLNVYNGANARANPRSERRESPLRPQPTATP